MVVRFWLNVATVHIAIVLELMVLLWMQDVDFLSKLSR